MRRLNADEHIDNMVTGQAYRIEGFLGMGGFGAAYLAQPLARGRDAGPEVCLKLTDDPNTWHGEAYFGGLLSGQMNAVQQIDAFPTTIVDRRGRRTVFAILMEYVDSGTVEDACRDGRLPWSEDRVARKIKGLLKPLALLHNLGTAHRDIKPANVYVLPRAVLKLGDFGIAKARLQKSGVEVDMWTPAFSPPDLGRYWRTADDVYQVGLLMMTLLTGEPTINDVGKVQVNKCTSRDFGVRAAVKAAISVKSQRPQTADELLAILP